MQATFETTLYSIYAACNRADVIVDTNPPRSGYSPELGVAVRVVKSPIKTIDGTHVSVAGDANAIMRIIGALADDGDSSLRTVC